MDIEQAKKYLCAVCEERQIQELRVEHQGSPDEGHDVGGCDYSEYGGYRVAGGRLFTARPELPWLVHVIRPAFVNGGICTNCLDTALVKRLLPYLALEPVSEPASK